MAQTVVAIAGRTYRMTCDEGDEAHIEQLAKQVEARIRELRGAFGEIGELRIVVMASLSIADELFSARQKQAEAEAELASARADIAKAQLRQQELAESAAQALDKATVKVDAATKALNAD
jgi:cell division protein ZapA